MFERIKQFIFADEPEIIALGVYMAAKVFTTEELLSLKSESEGHKVREIPYEKFELEFVVYNRPDGYSIGCSRYWVHVLETKAVDPYFSSKYKRDL